MALPFRPSEVSDPARPACAARPYTIEIADPAAKIRIRVRLTPKSSRDAIEGITATPDGPAIKARVRAVPENGAANKALIAVIAKWLKVPKNSITLSAGSKSRTKLFSILAPTDAVDRIIGDIDTLSQHRKT